MQARRGSLEGIPLYEVEGCIAIRDSSCGLSSLAHHLSSIELGIASEQRREAKGSSLAAPPHRHVALLDRPLTAGGTSRCLR